ncbi:MAG: hypothetical protein QM669_12965 [Siphonobacter sp.]
MPITKKYKTGVIILSCIPILVFFFVVFMYASNIPFQDDYDGLLEPVTRIASLSSFEWSGFFKIIWIQDDERRIVLDRVIAIALYGISGSLNFKAILLIGLLSVVGLFVIFATVIKQAKLPYLLLISFSLLLFHIQYYEAILWPMIPLQHIAVYFFALLTSYFLYKHSQLLIAILFAWLTVCCDVSGTFILPTGVVLLLIQKRWKGLFIWSLLVGISVGFYYYKLELPAYRPKPLENLRHPLLILSNLFTFSGLSVDFNGILSFKFRIILIISWGFFLIIYTLTRVFSLIKNCFFIDKKPLTSHWEITLWGGIIHIGITMLAFAVGRAIEGLDAVLISRYKHVGFIWLILIYLLFITSLGNNNKILASKAILVFATVISVYSYFQYWANIDFYYKERQNDIYEWQTNRALPSTPIYLTFQKEIDAMTNNAINCGVYHLPEYYLSNFRTLPKSNKTFPVDIKVYPGNIAFISSEYTRKNGKQDGAYLILSSKEQQHIIPSKSNRYSIKSFLFSFGKNYYANGFSNTLTTGFLKPNQIYTLSVLCVEGDLKSIYPTRHQIQTLADPEHDLKVITL